MGAIWHWLTTNGIGQNILANGVWAAFFGPFLRKHVLDARAHRAQQRAAMKALHDKMDHECPS